MNGRPTFFCEWVNASPPIRPVPKQMFVSQNEPSLDHRPHNFPHQ